MATVGDKTQIGLTAECDGLLGDLMEAGLFAAEGDAYKVGIAYALAMRMDIANAPAGGYQTKFNAAGGLDRDGTVRDLITVLVPEWAERPYATAERLAELGLREISRQVSQHESLAAILEAVQPVDSEG